MFVDEAVIFVKGGDGGNGCVSFRREKYVPYGGPDGGDGGKGGDIIIHVSDKIDTLLDLTSRVKYIAGNGAHGKGSTKRGKDGNDLSINLPRGTVIKDRESGRILKDMDTAGENLVIARGGRGGRGNKCFATSTNQVPRQAEKGRPGEERWLILELKLLADVGLIGMPNAGKSTLLSRISAARPKIADYPFTTLQPQLGIVEVEDYRRFVVADIPGLIEGAHRGVGLGDEFLRHIERTRLLVHLLDVSPFATVAPAEAYFIVRNELKQYNPVLAEKAEVVVANKIDLLDSEAGMKCIQTLEEKISRPVCPVSMVTGNNISLLISLVVNALQETQSALHASVCS
ncbi:MAG: GTPase ObgE [Planctomycetia bacterium]|nr:GTPase ObgE [Candidatus Brocadia sapporoensis]MCC7239170.1 GTPase ObgE [Candidatus Brocadia sp.]QOJ05270.1 MAG: GTPase ObgE [Planctomycetia bacterium]RZV58586.1 MAG: GTPase ObgE [Candidatus Brocadia sp. BROELEC01]TVL97367.1 MAG: GTPase ObgE [Candidatus Brocadia sp. BL1]TWU53226.1 GTPase Obg [Candidatus Brocadiaceae bacterium B188]